MNTDYSHQMGSGVNGPYIYKCLKKWGFGDINVWMLDSINVFISVKQTFKHWDISASQTSFNQRPISGYV